MLCYVMLCYVMLRYVTLRYAMFAASPYLRANCLINELKRKKS